MRRASQREHLLVAQRRNIPRFAPEIASGARQTLPS
jgi:hypothetical protein